MNGNKMVLLVIGVIVTFGVSLTGGYFVFTRGVRPEVPYAPNPTTVSAFSPEIAIPTQATDSQPTRTAPYLAQPVSAEDMFSEFICPCCGKSIGDCSCGMASERRGFVTALVSAGKNELEMYLLYADHYGLEGLASEAVKEAVREYRLAHAPEERPQIVLEPQKVDLGEVSTKEGKVEASITISNIGETDLIVESLSTSCGCTTVSVVNSGQEGPLFGTGTPPEDWSTTIKPGETAELRIYYDPTFHENARGPMMREIYISSNDPVDPMVKASIQLNQVD